MKIVIKNKIKIFGETQKERDNLIEKCTIPNKEYSERIRLGQSTWNIPDSLLLHEFKDDKLIVPLGFLSYIMKMQPSAIKDFRPHYHDISFGWGGSLRTYQERAARRLKALGGGIFVAPPAAGKTIFGLAMIAEWQKKAIWIAPTKVLANQAYLKAIRHYALPDDAFGFIGDSKFKIGTHITFATWQSLMNKDTSFYKGFGTLVFDECHRAGANIVFKTVTNFWPLHTLGLTATPDRDDGLTIFENAALGDIADEVSLDELEALGLITKPIVEMVPTEFEYRYRNFRDFNPMLAAMIADKKRNTLIVKTIIDDLKEPDTTAIVVSDRVKHCFALKDMLDSKNPELKSAVIYGATKNVDRERIISDLANRRIRLILSVKLASEGLDIETLTNIYITTGGHSTINLYQRSGRTMRVISGGTESKTAKVKDFVDKKIGVLLHQGKWRIRHYRHLGFKIVDSSGIESYRPKSQDESRLLSIIKKPQVRPKELSLL